MTDSNNGPVSRATVSREPSSQATQVAASEATATHLGGATRVQYTDNNGPTEQATAPHPITPSAKIVGTVNRAIMSGGQTKIEAEGNRRHQGSATAGKSGAPSIRSPFGVPKSGSDVRPSDIVTVAGMETSVAAALAAGLLVKDGQGNYLDAAGSPQQGAPQGQQQEQPEQPSKEQPQEPEIAPLDDATEALATEYATKVHSSDAQQAIKAMIEGQGLSDDLAAKAASQLGIEPGLVKEQVETIRAGFERQAQDAVGERVLAWARNHRMDALKDAARQQVNGGSLKGYQDLASEYVSNLADIDPEVILSSPDAAARGIARERDGRITLQIPGVGKVEWRAAIRAGLIGPKFRRSA